MKIVDAYSTKAQYSPGEEVVVSVKIEGKEETKGTLKAEITHLLKKIEEKVKKVEINDDGKTEVSLSLTPEVDGVPRGFGVDLDLRKGGESVDEASTSFHMAESWTQSPRYGFMSDFSPDETRKESQEKLDILSKFNVNALQFYDWLYRHDSLIPPEDEFIDPLGRNLSFETVKHKVDLAATFSMSSMAYNAAYSASKEYYSDHKELGLYDNEGEPHRLDLNDTSLYIMDPSDGSKWRAHILDEYRQVLEKTGFDGLHVDQYGRPKFAYTEDGREIGLHEALPDFVNAAKRVALDVDSAVKVAFNAVGNWPVQSVAPANQDIVYIELWPPDTTYKDIADKIEQAHELGRGKQVVLAAYIPASHETAVKLADAVIFAHGGDHIELGEGRGMLSGPYFPDYDEMSADLYQAMRDYYDFRVRYEELLSPEGPAEEVEVEIDGLPVSMEREHDSVWVIAGESDRYLALNLINLVGVNPFWKGPKSDPPEKFESLSVNLALENPGRVEGVYIASPDTSCTRVTQIPYERSRSSVMLEVPALKFWDLLILDRGGGNFE